MSKQSKHTPGEWHVERHQRFTPYEEGGPGGSFQKVGTWFYLIVQEDENDPKLRTPIAEISLLPESESNARIIALAPEMAEVLKSMVETLPLELIPIRARAILAKLEKDQP